MSYDLFAELVDYPAPDVVAQAEALRAQLDGAPAAALERFAVWAAGVDEEEREELYTRSFDLQPAACLELGWHVFGETYHRGPFLVKLRQALRAVGLDEGTELPDHLPTVLRLVTRLPPEADPRGLVEEALLPALAKIREAVAADNPYRALLDALAERVRSDYGLSEPTLTRRLPLVTEGAEP